jgi:hypothetical protein
MALRDRVKKIVHAWNAFINDENSNRIVSYGEGMSFGSHPSRTRLRWSNERSIIASIYTRVSIDVSGIYLKHVRLDADDRFLEEIPSGLNKCLNVEPNMDQGPRQFRQDIAMTLFDKGVAAIVPVDTTINPELSGGFDIQTMRVGEVKAWMPSRVQVSLYNEAKGLREEIPLAKKFVAIVENPLYSVMNEPNSTLQRLIRKLNLLDAVDEQSSSGKLDIIIQLPYVIKSEARRASAQQRRVDLEQQLNGSKYGIGYVDGTEKIIQLNRPAENNLLTQIEYLTKELYAQLGLTPEVMNGTADEKTMLNYHNRTVKPIVDAIVEAMRRSFLTKTALAQKQWIMAFRNPFELVPINEIADIADKFARNLIAVPNDIRTAIGWKPSKDPKADQLKNNNMPDPNPTPSESPSLQPTG